MPLMLNNVQLAGNLTRDPPAPGECRCVYDDDGSNDHFELSEVSDFMIKHGYSKLIKCDELHLGVYSGLDPTEE